VEKYSPYIKKYIREIKEAGYIISDNGYQFSMCVGCYEILIRDLTVKSLFSKAKTILVWVKDKNSRTIEVERLFKHEILPLPFHKINSFAHERIIALKGDVNFEYEDYLQEIMQDASVSEINRREVKIKDRTIEV
jgi:hypothetical protein